MHARLLAVVVLPSDGVALVNRMNFGGCPGVDSSSDVRSERNASVNCDFGCVSTLIFRCAVVRFASLLRCRAPRPRNDRQRRQLGHASISAMLRRPVSRLSSRNASTMPPSRPKSSVGHDDRRLRLHHRAVPETAPVDDVDLQRLQAGLDAGRAQPLQQTFVQRPVRFELALPQRVLHQVVAQLVGVGLLRFERRGRLLFVRFAR